MRKIAIVLAVMLVLGVVFISGCTTTTNNTPQSNNSQNQNKSSGIPGYSTAQIVNVGSENIVYESDKTIKI